MQEWGVGNAGTALGPPKSTKCSVPFFLLTRRPRGRPSVHRRSHNRFDCLEFYRLSSALRAEAEHTMYRTRVPLTLPSDTAEQRSLPRETAASFERKELKQCFPSLPSLAYF